MPNLIDSYLIRQQAFSKLKEKIRILRTKNALPINRNMGDIYLDPATQRDEYAITYIIEDKLHTNNLMILRENYKMTTTEIRTLVPEAMEVMGGLYTLFYDVNDARIVLNRILEYIYKKQKEV